MKKLYQIHCGYYDPSVAQAVYEFHVNYFVVAESFEEARLKAKEVPEFKEKKMHVDGVVEINAIDGYQVSLSFDPSLEGASKTISQRHRDLAPQNTKTHSAT